MRARVFVSALSILVWPAFAEAQSVRVQVIDRGQADGILIRTPNQRWVVIDAGADRMQADAMASQWGVDSVALFVISHRHADHFGGAREILRRFPVGLFVMNLDDCPGRVTDDRIREEVALRGVRAQGPGADTVEVDGVRFIILPRDPDEDACPGRENDNSILVRMEFGKFAMLFTGDAETAEREWLMANHPSLLRATVLKASHHGSRNGADGLDPGGQSWIQVVNPQDVVISVLRASPHGHPHGEAMDAYEAHVTRQRVFCTSLHGTIRIFGFEDGTRRVTRQRADTGSCRFP
jgi:beta-lactamase superfamily II metal-dependent hydrolase